MSLTYEAVVDLVVLRVLHNLEDFFDCTVDFGRWPTDENLVCFKRLCTRSEFGLCAHFDRKELFLANDPTSYQFN